VAQSNVIKEAPVRPHHPTRREVGGWFEFYEKMDVGTVPSPEECESAPPTQKVLSEIPIRKSVKKTSILGHFYKGVGDKFTCMVMLKESVTDINGEISETYKECGKSFKKSGGGNARRGHVNKHHPRLLEALMEFRNYQCRVQGIEMQVDPEENELSSGPTAPGVSKFGLEREEVVLSNLKQPLPYEIKNFHETIIKLIAVKQVNFNQITSDIFIDMVSQLNPHFEVPAADTLKRMLEDSVFEQRIQIKEYIGKFVDGVAITADCWTSRDRRKYLGVTAHFILPSFQLITIVIGMEPAQESHTSDNLLELLGNINLHNYFL